MSTPPSLATNGNTWPGRTKSAAPLLRLASARTVLLRSSAEMPVVRPCRTSTDTVQAVGFLGGQRRADDAGGVADDERHLLGRAERGGDEQVALVLAIIVVGDDHDLALGEGGDDGLDTLMSFDVHDYAFLHPPRSNGQDGPAPIWAR